MAARSTDAATPRLTDGGVVPSAESSPAKDVLNEGIPNDGQTAEIDETKPRKSVVDDDSSIAETETEPYKDPVRLREVYEAHETFPEMTEALGATVTPQTVRHHTIKHGIHQPKEQRDSEPAADRETADPEPSEDDTESEPNRPANERESDATAETAETDVRDEAAESSDETATAADTDDGSVDVDLPTHVTLDEIKRAVTESTTLFEVQRDLRTDRSTARRILRDLDLLDFVGGRVDAADGRRESMDRIDERIQQARS